MPSPTEPGEAARPRRKRRWILRALALVLVGIVALLLLGPTIAGPIARPMVESAVNGQIRGHAQVSSLRLSWLGDQRADLTLDDPEGRRVAGVTARLERGLLGLATGGGALGRIVVGGRASIDRAADGTTNLQRAIEPRVARTPSPDTGGPDPLPPSLSAEVVLGGLEVEYTDAALAGHTEGAIGAVRLGALTGSLDFAVGRPILLKISGPLATGPDRAGLAVSGNLDLRLELTGLTDASGAFTLDDLGAALSLAIEAPALSLAAEAGLADGVLSLTGPTSLTLRTPELASLAPALREALASQPGVTIDTLPEATLRLERLTLPLAVLGAGVPERFDGVALLATLETTRAEGVLDLPGGPDARPRAFAFEPLRLSLESAGLGEGVRLTGGTRATIDGASAGDFSIDLAAGGLLDGAGAFRTGPPEQLEGSLRVEGFSTPILQPLVGTLAGAMPEGVRLDLPADLGPTIDLALDAASRGTRAYDLTLTLRSERATADAALAVDGTRITTRGEGVRVELASAAALVDRFAAAHGVRVERGASVTLRASEVALDLARLGGPDGLDLRGVRARAELAVGDASGRVQLLDDTTLHDYRLERFTLGLATDDLDGRVDVSAEARARLGDKPLGAAAAAFTLSGLLGPEGAPATGRLPTLAGQARLEGLALDTVDAVFGGYYRERGLVLARDIGPTAELVVLAASNPEAGPEATNLDVTFRAQHLDITAPLIVRPDRMTSRDAVILVGRAAPRTIGQVLGFEGPVRVTPDGSVRLVARTLDVPIGPGGVRPDLVSASLTATATGMAVNIVVPAPDGAAGPLQRLEIPEFRASVTASPGEAPRVDAGGEFRHADQPFTLAIEAILDGLLLDAPTDPDRPMSVLAFDRLLPRVSLEARGVPATLSRAVPPGSVRIGEEAADVVLLVRDLLGRTFDATLTTRPSTNRPDTLVYETTLDGLRADWRFSGRARADMVSLDRARAELGVTPRVLDHVISLAAPDAPVRPELTDPARVTLALDAPFEVPLGEGFAPDLAGAGTLEANLALDAALAALTLPAGQAAPGEPAPEPRTIPPVRLDQIALAVRLPAPALGEGGGEAEAKLTGRVLDGASGTPVVTLASGVRAPLRSGAPAGETPIELTLSDIHAPWIDALLGKPALVEGALSERFTITLSALPQRLAARDPSAPALSFGVRSERLTTEAPLRFTFNPQAVYLQEQVQLSWLMGPRWANRYALGAEPGGPPAQLAFTEQTRVNLAVRRLALSMGPDEGEGPFRPGVFILVAEATAPDVAARLGDGRDLRLGGLELAVHRGPSPDQIGFALTVPRMRIGDGPDVTPQRNRITGRVADFADALGNLNPGGASVTLEGGLAPIPTAVIDGLARQDGLLVDLLGPTIDFGVDARDFGRAGGRIAIGAVAPHARAQIEGVVADGLFVIDPEASLVEATRITPQATARLRKAIPPLATLEKRPEDEPARIVFDSPIAVPMDGNLDRLSGRFTIDVGTARYATTDFFQRVLAVAQQKSAGEIGRRIPPLKVTMADGLVSYDPFPLPLGEFRIETRGFINLSSKPRQIREGGGAPLAPGHMEVLTFIPAGAFAAEAIPGLANIPLPIVGNLARLPVRTSGLIASPKTDIAADLVGREAVNTLLEPGRIIQEGAGGLLDDLLGGRRRKRDEQR
jgi:hypothetical protein